MSIKIHQFIHLCNRCFIAYVYSRNVISIHFQQNSILLEILQLSFFTPTKHPSFLPPSIQDYIVKMSKNVENLRGIFVIYIPSSFISIDCESSALEEEMIEATAIVALFLVLQSLPSVHLCVHFLDQRLPEANARVDEPVRDLSRNRTTLSHKIKIQCKERDAHAHLASCQATFQC